MKTNEIKKMEINVQNLNGLTASEIGDDHISTSLETPMRKDAFKTSDEEKKNKIALLFEEIMNVMGFRFNRRLIEGYPKTSCKNVY